MPFPFTLPTTSNFSLPSVLDSPSHPSLPLTATTRRSHLRALLKTHKRLPPTSQPTHLSSLFLSLDDYLPYLLALDAGLGGQVVAGEEVDVILKCELGVEWRATLSASSVPGREPARVKLASLEWEVYFVMSTLAYAHTQSARAALQPLYSSTTASLPIDQRTAAITTATRSLLAAAGIHTYLLTRAQSLPSSSPPPPCPDIAPATFRALSDLALAEATLLAVLKDDPYPAASAQERNKHDKEWMIKAPSIPKVRAHLFARLCLSAADHSAHAAAALRSIPATIGSGAGIDDDLKRYVDNLQRVGRAKACRFFGVDAELEGKTGHALAWLRAGRYELNLRPDASAPNTASKKGLGHLKQQWSARREDKKVERGGDWGLDAGYAEEGRVLDMLEAKWARENDTVNTQLVPEFRPLVATMPSGRNIYTVKTYVPPALDATALRAMRAPVEADVGGGGGGAEGGGGDSSDEENNKAEMVVGAFPGTGREYGAGSGSGGGAGTGFYY